MRIVIVTAGSLGDVRPYAALGVGLRGAGHEVRLVTHEAFRTLARECDLDFVPLSGDPLEVLESAEGQEWLHSGYNVVRFISGFKRILEPLIRQAVAECLDACQGADLILASLIGVCAAYHVAEKLQTPLVPAFCLPLSPTRSFPSVMVSATRSFGGTLNWWSHGLAVLLSWEPLRPTFNRMRRDVLGLPPLTFAQMQREVLSSRQPILYCCSPTLIPPPADWDRHVHLTGYWSLRRADAWTPPAALTAFLAAGPPPVYVGFGSMHVTNPAEVTALVVRALETAGQRGLLFAGTSGLGTGPLPESVLAIDSVPHDWLFPRTAAVVHHCGAGTTVTALAAGVPSVGVPFFADQPFWAARLAQVGAATAPVPFRHLSADRLARAIREAAGSVELAHRAAALGAQVRAENGVARAVDVINGLGAGRPQPRA